MLILFYRFEKESEVSSVLSSLAASFTTTKQYEKLKKYVSKLEKPSSTINKALQSSEYNLKWAEVNIPYITDFVEQYVKETPSSAMTHSVSCIALSLATFYFFYEYCLN